MLTKRKREKEAAMSKEIQTEKKAAASTIGLFTRQPLSPLGKIAFWGFLVATIGSVGGAVAIAIGSGSPSRDIVIFAAMLLATTILVATGIRWLQAIAIPAGVYAFYLFFTQPYVIESLSHPKDDPQGGFGHYIGDMVPLGLLIIAFVATITMVVQDYRGGSRKYPRWFTSVLGGAAGIVIGALLIGALAQPPAVATLTYTNGVPTVHLNPGGFDLTSATIPKGSKLLLIDDTSEQHVLANGTWQGTTPVQKREPGAPLVSRLSLSGNRVTIGPFTTAGTYHILCLIHRGMELTIIVQ